MEERATVAFDRNDENEGSVHFYLLILLSYYGCYGATVATVATVSSNRQAKGEQEPSDDHK